MKFLTIATFCLLLAGCQSGPQITLDSSDGKQTLRYGPYFENEKFPVGATVLVDAVITLGAERLPKDYKAERETYYSDGEVEAVLEFYFTNLTDKPVELKIEDFKCRLFRGAIGPKVIRLAPKTFAKSTPLVALTSNYVTKPWDYSMTVEIDGHSYPIQDKLARMTIEQLKARHGN
jgi:hypothetical protein